MLLNDFGFDLDMFICRPPSPAPQNLCAGLTGHHVNTLIVSGGETDVCVLSTVLSPIDLGYRIILVQDALCSSSDESHDAILGLYRKRFDIQVGVAGLEQILGLWKPE